MTVFCVVLSSTESIIQVTHDIPERIADVIPEMRRACVPAYLRTCGKWDTTSHLLVQA